MSPIDPQSCCEEGGNFTRMFGSEASERGDYTYSSKGRPLRAQIRLEWHGVFWFRNSSDKYVLLVFHTRA